MYGLVVLPSYLLIRHQFLLFLYRRTGISANPTQNEMGGHK